MNYHQIHRKNPKRLENNSFNWIGNKLFYGTVYFGQFNHSRFRVAGYPSHWRKVATCGSLTCDCGLASDEMIKLVLLEECEKIRQTYMQSATL
jgi:hypothetical protein